MSSIGAASGLGDLKVVTTYHRGASVEEVAERAMDKIIHISDNANPVIREQALVFRAQIKDVLEFYMREAIRGNNTTLVKRLQTAGHAELIPLILESE